MTDYSYKLESSQDGRERDKMHHNCHKIKTWKKKCAKSHFLCFHTYNRIKRPESRDGRPIACLLYTTHCFKYSVPPQFWTTRERATAGKQGKPLNTESEHTHGCIPQNFASFPASKAVVVVSDSALARSLSLPRFLVLKLQPSRRTWKKTPKTRPPTWVEGGALFDAQQLSKNPRLRLC